MRFIMALIISSLSAIATSHASDGKFACEECPFPLARIYGTWVNVDKSLSVEISEVRENRDDVWIHVFVTRKENNQVLFRGRALVSKQASAFEMDLTKRDRDQSHVVIEFNPLTNSLKIITGKQLDPKYCWKTDNCILLGRLGSNVFDDPIERRQHRYEKRFESDL